MKILLILLLWIGLFCSAPLWNLPQPTQTDASRSLEAPSLEALFGRDNAGRDVLSRLLYGGQRSLFTATLAAAVAILPALLLGVLAAMFPRLDKLIVIFLNTLMAFPALLLALLILTLLGRGLLPIALATGLAQMAFYARFVHGLIQQNQHQAYVLAAAALGANRWHILLRHLLPNTRAQLLSYASVTWTYCLINSAALSLLGLGSDPSLPDWGIMLATGRESFRHAPWLLLAPAVAIVISVILVNRLADNLGKS
jgi:peptide/nickel transport system permease protein